METIESLLISRGDVDRICKGEVALYLWRAFHNSAVTTNPLYPDFEAREIRAGVLRAPDVEIQSIGGVACVVSRLGDGTALFDKPDDVWSS